jgi:chemotaxis protein MotA
MDIATLIGVIIGPLAAIQFGMGGFQNLGMFWDPHGIGLMAGGVSAAVLISFPLGVVLKTPQYLMHVIKDPGHSLKDLIAEIVSLAEKARRDGILALESAMEHVHDPFLKKGIQLAVDGTDPELIKVILSEELEAMKERHKEGRAVLVAANKYFPAWGMVGTLTGMVLLLANLNDPAKIGPSMALALTCTFYGAFMSNYFLSPCADKLNIKNAEEVLIKTVILNGVMAIQQGDNPRIVMQKLEVYLPPKDRTAKEK